MDKRNTWQHIDAIEATGQLKNSARLYHFMRCCCRSLADLLPPEAEEWFEVADRYRAGCASESDLLAARLKAWDYLGTDSCNFASARVNAVRTVLFLMFPDDDPAFDDASLVLSHFVDFCEGAGVSADWQRRCSADAFGLRSCSQSDQ